MDSLPFQPWSRRKFLGHLTAAGAVGLTGLRPGVAAAEPPPETTSIRIVFDPRVPLLCYGPQYVATELLRMEGFTEISYSPFLDDTINDAKVVGADKADITAAWVGDLITEAEAGKPVVGLSGMHIGCTEVFAHESIKSFRDLRGKKVALFTSQDSAERMWFSIMFSYIGLDPDQDIEWVIRPYEEWGELLAAREVDAVMVWPPDAQRFREQNIGHVILNTTTDRPWKDYFCCLITGNRKFVNENPVATKRALRAMLKATDLCALEPELAARSVIDNGFPTDYERALQVFREVPYAQWREFDPEDTLRFYALRMHKLGLIQRPPNTLVTWVSDWRFLNELKQELKA
ncbi:MAG: ABC transporter substrate-binding protein [Gammaproteobacteria bacterium]|nr:MAG: ABC transporter substrate-binding protein [Gammaproteobacteria bacterium]